MERTKIVGRKQYWKSQKEKMLRKSNHKCAHCGMGIDLSTMTVEHVIPLSKGGTNDLQNTVALCHECNKKKRNYVSDPSFYYGYLLDEYKEELQKYYEEYIEKFDYISLKSFFKDEVFSADLLSSVLSTKGLSRQQRRRIELDNKKLSKTIVSLDIRDIDKVIEFCDTYVKRFKKDKDFKYDRDIVEQYLSTYAVYGVKSGSSYSAILTTKPNRVRYFVAGLTIEVIPLYENGEMNLVSIWATLMRTLNTLSGSIVTVVFPESSKFNVGFAKLKTSSRKRDGLVYKTVKAGDYSKGDFVYEKFGNILDFDMPELRLHDKFYGCKNLFSAKWMTFKEFIKYQFHALNPRNVRVSPTLFIENLNKSVTDRRVDKFISLSMLGFFKSVLFGLCTMLFVGGSVGLILRACIYTLYTGWYVLVGKNMYVD